ncbi:MAG: hypothetical protein IMX02_13075 [Limnochordaceae bacterium]|nr:hypothetical protein [Limnochordaceae bacterium]
MMGAAGPASPQSLWQALVVQPVEALGAALYAYLPRVGGAILVLAAGRIAAGVLRRLARDVLRATGFDVVMQRLGLSALLQRGSIAKRPSELAAQGIFWLVIVSAVMLAFEVVGLDTAAVLVRQLVDFLPRLLAALALVALGLWAADASGRFMEQAAGATGLPGPGMWGQLVRWGVLGFAIVAVLEQLQIASATLRAGLLALLAAGPVGVAIAMGLGGQGVARELIAGQAVRSMLRPGERVELKLDGRRLRGRVERFDLTATWIRPDTEEEGAGEESQLVGVPHSYLTSQAVSIVRPAP